jgi:hypothetical protein
MEDARSETIRDVWEWYNETVYNRLQPGGAIVPFSHRKHEDDLAGTCAARRRSSSPPFMHSCQSCHGELGFGYCLGESFKRELVTPRSIAVCSVLRRGNWNPALAVLNKHLAVAR